MKRLLAAALVLASLGFARPARADSDVFFVTLSSLTSTGSAGAVVSTAAVISHALKYYSLQVRGSTGTASSWDVRLEGSLDGVGWSSLITHGTADGDRYVKTSSATAATFPLTWIRARVNALTLGSSATAIQVNAIGSQ